MYYLNSSKWVVTLFVSLLIVISSGSVYAEDTEIFAGELPPSKPNVLFLLDQSGSMNTEMGTAGDTRLSTLQDAFNAVVTDPDIAGLNVGLMSFSKNGSSPFPHGVSFPVSHIDDDALPIMLSNLLPATLTSPLIRGYFTLGDDTLPDPTAGQTVRDFLPQILSSWTAFGATPIVDAYYEAALYFRGAPPLWGAASAEYDHSAHPSTYNGSILSQVATTLTGKTKTCTDPDCGVNCVATTTLSKCAAGETSCHLGTNCQIISSTKNRDCGSATIAQCLAANPNYSSCSLQTGQNCSETCSGAKHPESGECLGVVTRSCTTTSKIVCQADEDYLSCDKASYNVTK